MISICDYLIEFCMKAGCLNYIKNSIDHVGNDDAIIVFDMVISFVYLIKNYKRKEWP
jgi:hypothetical protein